MPCRVTHRAHIQEESGMFRSVIEGDRFCGPDGELLMVVRLQGEWDEEQEERIGKVNGDAAIVQEARREGQVKVSS